MASAGGAEEDWRKRLALTGQWKTPPTPMYAAGVPSSVPAGGGSNFHSDPLSQTRTATVPNQGSHAAVQHNAIAGADYTAALQEAYLRGAQAAAALAARSGSTGNMNTITEATPHTTVLPLPAVPNPLLGLSASDSMGMPPPQHPQPSHGHREIEERHDPKSSFATTDPTTSTAIAASAAPFPFVTPISSPNSLPAALPVLASGASNPHQTVSTQHAPPLQSQTVIHQGAALAASQAAPPRPVLSYPPRAMSMPNMGFDMEEEKRQKRLARNRASARLRRMRKKNLVEAYEVEVGILEKTLESLKSRQWGIQDEPRALIEALSLDRGQQHLTMEERYQASKDILDQQLQYVGLLEDSMREQFVMLQLAQDKAELSDLKDVLHLSPEQCARIADAASGWEEDWCALQTVKSSLEAMRNSSWLLSEKGNSVVEGFLSLLHKTQISKLLLWCDHNIDSIDDLDYVNASFDPNPASGPLFQFGISNNPDCLLEASSGKIE